MRTLERKKSSASRLNSVGGGGQNGVHPPSSSSPVKNEFDDLISALRTGDVFAGENMDKFRRNRKFRNSPPRMDRADSFLRERGGGYAQQQQPQQQLHQELIMQQQQQHYRQK